MEIKKKLQIKKQCQKNLKPFLLIGIITFILCLLPLFSALDLPNQTVINEYVSNSSIRLDNAISLTSLDINETLQRIIFYNISSNYSKITNINNTYKANLGFYNSTDNSLVYLQNGSGWFNLNNLNVTIGTNNYSIFLPSFNCSESLQSSTGYPCGRENSPININSVSDTGTYKTYHITSNLTNNISNVPVTVTIDCKRLMSVSYIPKGNISINPSYSCSGQVLTFSGLDINPSNDSNELILFYRTEGCQSSNDIITGFLIMVPLIIIFVVIFLVLGIKNGSLDGILNSPDKLIPILGGVLLLLLIIGIGSIIVFSIGRC